MSHDTWKNADIWKEICSRSKNDDNCQLTLQICMPNIESVLKSGGTSPVDFTLHDNEHGYRVAQMMIRLIPKDVLENLGTYELSLLLLSAYLHDIGMTPSRSAINSHFRYILTGDKSILQNSDLNELQNWLDEEHDGLEMPIDPDTLTASNIKKSEEILSYYCRHKHNDWSESWIRENLSSVTPGLYPAWIDDLVTLCRSHHDGIAQLRTGKFDSRIAGSNPQVVNLRYLAAVLRVADVLEFDPERTPEVILDHRDIIPSSRIYWYKDQEISFQIDRERNQLHFTARTSNSHIHKAVLDTARWVDNELLCCSALQQEGAFLRGHIPEDSRFYRWPWPSKLSLDIKERDESFVFIEGAFRPNTKQILELLSGTALYGNPLAAVRELLQNAFDAVKEQIARERLSREDADNKEWEDILGKLNKVAISIEFDNDGYWLVCTDTGVGMTKHIIEKYLLVSGSSRQADVIALERSAKKKGFSSGRTGQFGIGVLSYFMIADRLVVRTRRSADAGGDPDNHGWQFSIGGIDTFGQLSPISRSSRGTEVRLHIKNDVIGSDVEKWKQDVQAYIEKTIMKVPCRFESRVNITNVIDAKIVGWSGNPDKYKKELMSSFPHGNNSRDASLMNTTEDEERIRIETEAWKNAYENGLNSLGIKIIDEGDLPNKKGSYRVSIPYFTISGKNYLAFMQESDGGILPLPDGRTMFLPRNLYKYSWKGISVSGYDLFSHQRYSFRSNNKSSVILEVDMLEGAEISVDRSNFTNAEKNDELFEFLKEVVDKAFDDFLSKYSDISIEVFNEAVSGRTNKRIDKSSLQGKNLLVINLSSICADGDNANPLFQLKPVSGPAIEAMVPIQKFLNGCSGLDWKEGHINLIGRLKKDERIESISLMSRYACNQIAIVENTPSLFVPAALWEDTNTMPKYKNHLEMSKCVFPKEWSDICSVRGSLRRMLNNAHEIVASIDEEAINWSLSPQFNQLDSVEDTIKGATISKSRACIWIIFNSHQDIRFFQAIEDRFPKQMSIIKNHITSQTAGDNSRVIFLNLDGRYTGSCTALVLDQGVWRNFDYVHCRNNSISDTHLSIPVPSDDRFKIRLNRDC